MIEMKHINLSFRDKDLFTDQEIKIDSGKNAGQLVFVWKDINKI